MQYFFKIYQDSIGWQPLLLAKFPELYKLQPQARYKKMFYFQSICRYQYQDFRFFS